MLYVYVLEIDEHTVYLHDNHYSKKIDAYA